MTALTLPVLIGSAALAVDVSTWLGNKNTAQGAADFAALSAVAAAVAGNSTTRINSEAMTVASVNGFTNGQSGVTVTVNNPPKSGNYTSNSGAYEVIITQPQTLYFAGILGVAPTAKGRAVGLATAGAPACILALSSSAQQAIDVSGSASITANNCAVVANSTNAKAINTSGGGCITTAQLKTSGNYNNGSGCIIATAITTGASPTADPYAGLTIPSFSGCDQNNYQLNGGGVATINPGVYCGGIAVSSTSKLTMNPGTYILDSGNFSISGSATVVATSGVSIILTSTSNHYGGVAISGGTNVSITAPSSGAMAGIAIYVDRNAPTQNDGLSGSSSQNIVGAIYAPSQNIQYSGGSSSGTACTQLVALTFSFSGSSLFGRNCGSVPVAGLQGGGNPGLVE